MGRDQRTAAVREDRAGELDAFAPKWCTSAHVVYKTQPFGLATTTTSRGNPGKWIGRASRQSALLMGSLSASPPACASSRGDRSAPHGPPTNCVELVPVIANVPRSNPLSSTNRGRRRYWEPCWISVAFRCVPLRVHQDVLAARHVFAVCATVVAGVFVNLSDEIVLIDRDDRFLAAATDGANGHGVLRCGWLVLIPRRAGEAMCAVVAPSAN